MFSKCVNDLYHKLLFLKNLLLLIASVACNGIFVLWIIWIWLFSDQIPNLIAPTNGLTFDYIIVGSGTAGSVLANRLSSNQNISVLLIEAGHTFPPYIKVPLLATFVQNSGNDWKFLSTSQKYSSRGLKNRMQSLPRGKGIGGSSQINYLLHYEGIPEDYDNWANNFDIKIWEYKRMRKYLIKSKFKCNLNNLKISEFCYRLSENVTDFNENIWEMPENYSLLTEAFIKSNNNESKFKFELSQYNIRNGVRWSVYETFLRPCFKRENLKIISNTLVKKIKLKNNQATSVIIINNYNDENFAKELEIFANKEIILSAGTFQTPQLLQLSGIGSREHLKSVNIKPIIESPMIGQNLFDHLNLPLFVSINESASLNMNKLLNPFESIQYLTTGKGYFSNFGVIGHLKSKQHNFGASIFGTGFIDESVLKDLANFEQEVFRTLFPLYHNSSQEGFVILSTCYQPKSRGTVLVKSSNIKDNPEINPNYLKNKFDINCTINAIESVIRLITTSESLQRLNPKIHWPKLSRCLIFGPKDRDFVTNQPNRNYLECVIRTVGLASHHPGGTCAMGSNPQNVLDHRLKVRSIDGLRVIDASIFPTPVSGTPNSVLIAVAKKAANLILKDY